MKHRIWFSLLLIFWSTISHSKDDSVDGLYLPRCYALTSDGKIMDIISNHPGFHYFYAADDTAAYRNMMNRISTQSEGLLLKLDE